MVAQTELEAPRVRLGQWFSFVDSNGPGFAQADALICDPTGVYLLEAKLSQCAVAWEQLERLYLPLVAWTVKAPRYVALQVCKVLTTADEPVAPSLAAAGDRQVWHWLG